VLKSHDDGRPLLVIRPNNPALALSVAKVALDKNDPALLERLPQEVGDYTVQGWLGPDSTLLDRDGRVIGKCKPGDSFVTMRDHQ
jgi:hypothetical protein